MPLPTVCVYTSIMGGYDTLQPVVPQTLPTRFICFTDQQGMESKHWTVLFCGSRDPSPRLAAKYFKVLNHRVFVAGRLDLGGRALASERFDYTIWIDGCVAITDPHFCERLIAAVGSTDWAMFPHPHRRTIFAEAQLSAQMVKYKDQPVLDQVRAYAEEGFQQSGLYMATIIVRRSMGLALAAIGEMWWRENVRWTIQDQISLPVVLWRLNWRCDPILGIDLLSNHLFTRDVSHRMAEYQRIHA